MAHSLGLGRLLPGSHSFTFEAPQKGNGHTAAPSFSAIRPDNQFAIPRSRASSQTRPTS